MYEYTYSEPCVCFTKDYHLQISKCWKIKVWTRVQLLNCYEPSDIIFLWEEPSTTSKSSGSCLSKEIGGTLTKWSYIERLE